MNKHTPGPWIERGAYVVGGNPQELIADCACGRDRINQDDANARLIAAAPELLAVVQALLLGREKIDGRLLVDENSPLIDEARAAIARATGAA